MPDFISLSEWFSSTKTSTFVIEADGATLAVEVCLAGDDGVPVDVVLVVEHPANIRARMQKDTAARRIASL
jgi:hypothetical protein